MKKIILFIAVAFVGMKGNSQTLLHHFNFDGNYYNNSTSVNFTSLNGTYSLAMDRFNATNKAVYVYGSSRLSATISNLPQGNASRTVSMWVNLGSNSVTGMYLFCYGTNANLQAFGCTQSTTETVAYPWSQDLSVPSGSNLGTWVMYTMTYDGTVMKLYKNATLIGTKNVALNTTGTTFRIGELVSGTRMMDGAIDDLRIYSGALTLAQITDLFNNNTLSTQNFQTNTLKAAIYPNPAFENLTIEIENELKSVEIYSLLGQKVMTATAKNVNISSLSKGIYMVRIEDKNKAVATQKLIIE